MYAGEVRIYAGQTQPDGWVFCMGQALPILSFPSLYKVLGTKYGGDGINTFKLPDFSGRAVVHRGKSDGLSFRADSAIGGEEKVLLTEDNIPAHTHISRGSSTQSGGLADPIGNVWGSKNNIPSANRTYSNQLVEPVHMADDILVEGGQDVPHNNMQPFLSLYFIICVG